MSEENASTRTTKETMSLQHIANNGSYLARGKTDSERLELMNKAQLIIDKARILDLDIGRINWKMFASEDESNLIADIPTILKKLLDISNEPTKYLQDIPVFFNARIDELANEFQTNFNPSIFAEMHKKQYLDKINQCTLNCKQYVDMIDARTVEIAESYQRIRELQDDIRKCEFLINDNSNINSFDKIMNKDCAWELIYIKIENKETDKLVYIAKQDCVVTYIDHNLNINKTLNFGRFLLIINFNQKIINNTLSSAFKIIPIGNNLKNIGSTYYHPHVAEAGTVCLGNASERLLERFYAQDFVSFSNLLWNLLQTYNQESPYRQFSTFKEKLSQSRIDCLLNQYFKEYKYTPKMLEVLELFRRADIEKLYHDNSLRINTAIVRAEKDIHRVNGNSIGIKKGTYFSFRCLFNNEENFKIRNRSDYLFSSYDLEFCTIVGSMKDFHIKYVIIPRNNEVIERYELEEKTMYIIMNDNDYATNDFSCGVTIRLENTRSFIKLNDDDFELVEISGNSQSRYAELLNNGYQLKEE